MTQSPQFRDPDPTAPLTNQSEVPGALRTLGLIVAIVSLIASSGMLILLGRTETLVDVGTSISSRFEVQKQWNPVAIGAAFDWLIQGAIATAVLYALASITEDLTAMRITAKRQAVHLMTVLQRNTDRESTNV